MTHSDDTTGLEQRKRKLAERAEPLMGADDAQRLTTMLRPGAAPTLAGLAARGSIDERRVREDEAKK